MNSIQLVGLFLVACPLTLAQKPMNLPVILPPLLDTSVNRKPEWGTCLLYMEKLTVVVFPAADNAEPKAAAATIDSNNKTHQFNFQDGYVNCLANTTGQEKTNDAAKGAQDFSFIIDITGPAVPAKSTEKAFFTWDGKIKMKLDFQTMAPYGWQLVNVTSVNDINIKADGDWISKSLTIPKDTQATMESVQYMSFGTYGDYNYACSQTKTAIFKASDNKDTDVVGVAFGNIQVQAFGLVNDPAAGEGKMYHFSHNVHDCVGTFSQGSWMGIIVALVLVTVLMFGYLMLNSVQTVDRFDDPKQKQLIINAKE